VIHLSPHKFRASDHALRGRIVSNEDLWAHLPESHLSDRDWRRDDRLGLVSRLDRSVAVLISVMMRQRAHQVGHQRKARTPRRQYPIQNYRTHARPHVMIDGRSLGRFALLPREFHCATQPPIGRRPIQPQFFSQSGWIKTAGQSWSHPCNCNPSLPDRISHDKVG
jgi:hypothetical protein